MTVKPTKMCEDCGGVGERAAYLTCTTCYGTGKVAIEPKIKRYRYKFDTIFDYYPQTDIIIPKYTIVLNGVITKKGVPIRQGDFRGLDLFKHIGQDLVAVHDNDRMTIEGLYT